MIKNINSYLKRRIKQRTKPVNTLIGSYTYGKPHIFMWTDKYKVVIGNFCSISENVKIIVDGNHRTDWVTTYPLDHIIKGVSKNPAHPTGKGDIIIGNDVWIGRDVTIMPGIIIGDGAVIGTGSIVTKDVGDYEIVAGNPAKHIRYRFTKDQIKELKKIKWWNWPVNKIKKNANSLQSSNIDEFIEKFKI